MTSLIITPRSKQELYLLKELLTRMNIEFKPDNPEKNEEDITEEWYKFSMMNFARAFSNDEPEYTSNMLKEPNPDYKIRKKPI